MWECSACSKYNITFQTTAVIWVSGKLSLRKLPSRTLPPMKILRMNIAPYESSPPVKITPWENYPQWNPLPTYKSYKWKKKRSYKIFCLEESCAIQHPYQNNQGPLWYTDNLTENTGLRYFLYRLKKVQKFNESENRQVAFTCLLYK